MPVSLGIHRARTGSFLARRASTFTASSRYSSCMFAALLFSSPCSFLLLYFTILTTQLTPVVSKSSKSNKLKFPILVIWWVIVPMCFFLILCGDIELNPGPDKNGHLGGKINFGFWNLNSIIAREGCKLNHIEALQSCNQYDLFGVCETWLNDKIDNKSIEIHGFAPEPLRADSPLANIHPRGGVCLYYKENLPIIQRHDLQVLSECIISEIKLKNNRKMFFALFYRSPSQTSPEEIDFMKKLDNIIALMNAEKPSLITLCGDFNARSPLLWSGDSIENSSGKLLVDFCISNCFEQLIDQPTHLPNENTETCIDLLLTNNSSSIVDSGVIPSPDPACKHQIVGGKINLHVPPPPKYKRRIWEYGKGNSANLKTDLLAINWQETFLNKSLDDMVDCFTKIFLDLAKRHIPSKIITVSDKDAPWVTPAVKCALKRNKRVYSKWVKRGRDINGKAGVNKIQNETNKAIKEAKQLYIDNLSKKLCDPNCGQKVFWTAYKKLLNKKRTQIFRPFWLMGPLFQILKQSREFLTNILLNSAPLS